MIKPRMIKWGAEVEAGADHLIPDVPRDGSTADLENGGTLETRSKIGPRVAAHDRALIAATTC